MSYRGAAVDQAELRIDLGFLLRSLWRGKIQIAVFVVASAVAGVIYVATAQPSYRAYATLSLVKDRASSGGLGQLANLASLAGVAVSNAGSSEYVATLESREFAASFISELDLMPVLFVERWDASLGKWRADGRRVPQIADGVEKLTKEIVDLSEDKRAGTYTLSLEWRDPRQAADWANLMVEKVNERLRLRAIEESERNIKFLRSELQSTTLVALQDSIGRVLEAELQKLMMAKGNEQFAFRIIDHATVPLRKSAPKPVLDMVIALLAGGVIGSIVVLLRAQLRISPPEAQLPRTSQSDVQN